MPTNPLSLISAITIGVETLLANQAGPTPAPTPTTDFATPDVIAALQTLNALTNPAPVAPDPTF